MTGRRSYSLTNSGQPSAPRTARPSPGARSAFQTRSSVPTARCVA